MKGKIVVLAGPSGAGKTSIVKKLIELEPKLKFSISATTRGMREGEKDGIDYYFISPDAFIQRIQNNEFLEYEQVYEGVFYGTLNSELNRIWGENGIPILDIDVKGAMSVFKNFSGKALEIFVHPGSIENLRERLIKRNTETEESLKKRLGRAEEELTFVDHFENVIYNYDLSKSSEEAYSLLKKYLDL